jgi:biotin carboxyl carrier protein
MKLHLTCNGAPVEIEILTPAPDCGFRVDGKPPRLAFVQSSEPGRFHVLLDGRSYDARVDGRIVTVNGHAFDIAVTDPRRWRRNSAHGGGEGAQEIASPMPGKVVRILVAPGDEVTAGQGLVVVEAMKMQNEMKAPRAGRVLSVSTQEGSTVAAGDLLATIA